MGQIEEQEKTIQEEIPEVRMINGVSYEEKFPVMLTIEQISVAGMLCNPIIAKVALPEMIAGGMDLFKIIAVIQSCESLQKIFSETPINGVPFQEFMTESLRKRAEEGDPDAAKRYEELQILLKEKVELEKEIEKVESIQSKIAEIEKGGKE